MTIQNILTLSIDAIAFSFAAIMVIDFALVISKAWCKSTSTISTPPNLAPQGICAATLAPIFEDVPEPQSICSETLAPTAEDSPEPQICTNLDFGAHLANDFSIRELKKQASVAKIKNYSVLTKAQLVEALLA